MAMLDLTPHVRALRESLEAVAAVGTPEARETARLLAAGMEPAVRMVLLDALSALAAEVTAAWDGGLVDVRVRGGDPEVVVVPDAPTPAVDDEPPAVDEEAEGGVARISLRLPEPLKVRAEQAAAARHTSLNTWLVRAVAAALHTPGSAPSGRGPRRLSGFARS
ncbi:toxin-antitoxin system HicB family antitoxin [Geodermatophilus sp. SYSU D00708]